MIEKITKCLYDYITSVNIEYEQKILDYRRAEMIAKLQEAIDEYEATPITLYDELYRPWANSEIITYLTLVDNLMNKSDEWQELSIGHYCNVIPDIVNRLNLLYDDIIEKAPREIIGNYQNSNTSNHEGYNIPSELDTDRARKYFTRAVEVGYMTINGTTAQWRSVVARLGYMCYKIYSQPRPIASLEKYFGVTKLSAAITQASYEAKRADVKKWRAEIDSKIFFD